jgi:chromosome partitioning protein
LVHARILAIANRKGGTGKTTVAVNLAAELGSRGYRVLVVDLDPQGHAGLGFGVGVGALDASHTIHAAFRELRVDLVRAICATTEPGVDILAADRNFDGQIRVSDPRCLTRAFERIKPVYNIVLIDTPPAAANIMICALLASDGVVVPTLLDHLSLDGVQQFARAYHHVMLKLQATLLGLAVAPMQVDFRTNMQKLVLAQLLSRFGTGQVMRGIRTDVGVAEAFGLRKPLRQHRVNSRAVDDFRLMADDVARRFNLPGLPRAGAGAPNLASRERVHRAMLGRAPIADVARD